MTDFTFITANDIHISDTNPRSRTDNFKETILGKISQMRTACDKLGADAALIAGDLFNLKNPSKNSHRLNQDLIREFKKFPCPIYMIEGNHDLTANNLDSLLEQPLGVLFEDKTVIQLRETIIEKDGHKISLVGIPYTENIDISKIKMPKKGDCKVQICLMHIYASLKSGTLFKEKIYGYDELSLLSPDIFVIGHYHIDQGIYDLKGKKFINIGSMSRGTLSEEDITHIPQIGFIKINIDDDKVSYNARTIKLKIKPANEIFDLEKREEEKKESAEILAFVEKLAVEATQSSIQENRNIEDIINTLDLAKTVKDKVLYLIHEAST